MNSNERSSHPSAAQIEALVEYLEENSDLARGFSKTQHARERSRRQWEELSVRLNIMGGTIKTNKQWTKYWADKKCAVKKKVTSAAARRRTGGGVEDDVGLSEVEERMVALFGGERFSTGGSHFVTQPVQETMQSLPQQEGISESGTSNASNNQWYIPPLRNSPVFKEAALLSNFTLTSPESNPSNLSSSLLSFPSNIVSPSRHGTSPSFVIQTRPSAGSSSSRQDQSLLRVPSELASPSRRGTTTSSSRTVRASRAAMSSATRPVASAPSQRQTKFLRITERLLRVEEQRLEFEQSNARGLQALVEAVTSLGERMVDRICERDRILTESVAAMGEGLKLLASAIRRDN